MSGWPLYLGFLGRRIPATMHSVWKRSQQGQGTTRQRILQVARLIRYRLNLAARALSVAKASAQGQLACDRDSD